LIIPYYSNGFQTQRYLQAKPLKTQRAQKFHKEWNI
jgi:hypothetical protein